MGFFGGVLTLAEEGANLGFTSRAVAERVRDAPAAQHERPPPWVGLTGRAPVPW